MSKSFIALVSYMGETLVLNVGFDDGYAYMLEKICSKWILLKDGCFCIYYCMPSNPRCFLGSEEEFSSLIALVRLLKMEAVNLEVVDRGSGGEMVRYQSHVASGSTACVSEAGPSHDIVPSFCKHEKKEMFSTRWDRLIYAVGQRFEGGAEEFRICLRKLSVAAGYDFKYAKNYGGRVKAVCALKEETGCPWMVSATPEARDDSFVVRKLHNVHKCRDVQISFKNKNMTSALVANLIKEDVRAKGSVRPVDIVKEFGYHYGMSISYSNAWKSVEKAKKSVYGTEQETFKYLQWYVDSILETNPGSRVVLDTVEGSGRFRRVFVAYDACIKGFAYCRPLLFLDGTYLKGAYKGHILSAVGKDGNQGLYPLAFAIVDSENGTNWEWFLENLRPTLDPMRVITFISDRNLGLLECLKRVFPVSFHAFCMQHLKRNLRDRLKGSHFSKGMKDRLEMFFTQCTYAPTVSCFEEVMKVFREEGGSRIDDFLSGLPPENWSNAYFMGNRYGEMCSNAVESFNKWVVPERELPVGSLIDILRVKLTKQLSDRRSLGETFTDDLCVNINRRLTSEFKEGFHWSVVCSSPGVFEVRSDPTVMVDLSKHFCSCRMWQLNGLPCSHAVVCILKSGQKCFPFVDSWFHSETYRMTYALGIQPVPTIYKPKTLSVEKRVLPPYSKRPPGRPKTKRIRSRGEDVSEMKCGRCGHLGNHNRRGCKVPLLM